jgi:hypothetical protein
MNRTPLLALALCPLLPGCTQTMYAKLFETKGVPVSETERAIKSKDYAKLKDFCAGKVEIDSRIANPRNDTCRASIEVGRERRDVAYLKYMCKGEKGVVAPWHDACDAELEVLLQAGDRAGVRAMCDEGRSKEACSRAKTHEQLGDLSAPDCATVTRRAPAVLDDSMRGAGLDELGPLAAALVKCGDTKTVFERLAGYVDGADILRAAEKATPGGGMVAALQAYVKGQAGRALFAGDRGEAAAAHVGAWLTKAGHDDQCDALLAAGKGAREGVRAALVPYFVRSECRQAGPAALELLASDEPNARAVACHALGKLGDRSALEKVEIVANNDRASRNVERPSGSGVFTKDYFVADACREAAGKIQLREKK